VRSTSFRLGARYPIRLVTLNPPPAAGRLDTTDSVEVEFTTTTDDVCRAGGGTPTARSLVYRPNYNEFEEPDAVSYEARLLSREFESGGCFGQWLVRSSSGNDKINLFLLTGDVSANGLDTQDDTFDVS